MVLCHNEWAEEGEIAAVSPVGRIMNAAEYCSVFGTDLQSRAMNSPYVINANVQDPVLWRH